MKPAAPSRVYFRYVAASAVSLGVDLSLFSAALVFGDRVVERGGRRTEQQALFVVSALAGLAVTALVVGAGDLLGAPPLASKLAAVAIGFQLTYLLRKKVVFA